MCCTCSFKNSLVYSVVDSTTIWQVCSNGVVAFHFMRRKNPLYMFYKPRHCGPLNIYLLFINFNICVRFFYYVLPRNIKIYVYLFCLFIFFYFLHFCIIVTDIWLSIIRLFCMFDACILYSCMLPVT